MSDRYLQRYLSPTNQDEDWIVRFVDEEFCRHANDLIGTPQPAACVAAATKNIRRMAAIMEHRGQAVREIPPSNQALEQMAWDALRRSWELPPDA